MALVDLGLDDPAAERLVADTEIPRHLPRGVARLPRQAHGLGSELGWIRCLSSWHVDSHPRGSMPQLSGVHGTGSTPVLEYEWVEDGKPYREFLVPARLVNTYPTRLVSDDE